MRPGTTSFLPFELGDPERVDHVVDVARAATRRTREVDDRPADRDVHLVGGDDAVALSVYLNCHHHCLPTTVTWTTSGPVGFLARLKIVATVGTAITARISAGMIVQLISSTVLPCDLLRVVALARAVRGSAARRRSCRRRRATPIDDRDPEERREEVEDLLARAGPAGAASSACCRRPGAGRSSRATTTASDDRRGGHASRRSRACGPTSAVLARPDRRAADVSATLHRPIRRIATL